LQRNKGSRDLTARNQGLKHNYDYKLKVYTTKQPARTSGGQKEKLRGLNVESRT
jgi:hypothetical protein